jgi:hypothetical protein
MVAFFRAPADPVGCVRQHSFRFQWIEGAWQVESLSPAAGC